MQLPAAFVEKYQKLLGDEASAFIAAITEGQVQKGFRINPLKPAFKVMTDHYGPEKTPAPYAKWGYLGAVSGKSFLHQAGYLYSQEPSAMIVAQVADAQPGERVLDLCGAPGGKSTQLAGQMQNQGLLVSNEIFPKRAKILAENIERWGCTNALVTNHAPADLVPHFKGFFDRIVVDAPCSGEGMFRKDEQAIAEWTAETPAQCQKRQQEILTSAVQMLRNGGELIYSTCTFAPEENEAVISWLVENYPFEILPIEIEGVSRGREKWGRVPDLAKTVRLWPQHHQGEGHFVAKLRFNGENPVAKSKKKKSGNPGLPKEISRLWQDFSRQFPLPAAGKLQLFGENLWLVPNEAPDLTGLKVLRAGIQVATVKKNRIEPAFNLAMAVKELDAYPQVEITMADWAHYVKGETFAAAGNQGWVLLVLDQVPVGFGKQVQGTVKNFFPKGLRFLP